MTDNIKMQDTKYTIEITKTSVITENHQISSKQKLNEASTSTNNLKLQGESSQLIQNFNKLNIKEIDPILLLSKQEYLSTENDFNITVDKINDFIFKLNNKGIEKKFERQKAIEYLNNNNINSQEIYNWLLDNQNSSNSVFLLGYFNYYGIVTSENDKKAFNLFINASEKSIY
jgi:hypothetical protein